MAKDDSMDKERACVFEAGWGRVFYEESKGHCKAEFLIEDERISDADVKLVWRVIENLIDGSRVGPLVDEKVNGSGERIAFSLSYEKGLKEVCSELFPDWMMNGQADSFIEMGIEFVLRRRDKAIELDTLEGFCHLHPQQILAVAMGMGEKPSYIQQMRFFGMDVESWPVSVIPTCTIQSGAWIGNVYAEHARAKPLVRTRWGWITLELGVIESEFPEGGVVLAVSVFESMRGVDGSLWGVNLHEDFSRWYRHFVGCFPRIGEHVEVVESAKCYQAFGFALAPRYEKEGWVELMKWLETGALDREIDRFSTALNLSPALLDRYFELVDYPLAERQTTRSLAENLLNGEKNGQ